MVKVYSSNGEFVVADEGGWLPGNYATASAARRAAEAFSPEQLQRLQDQKNRAAGGSGGTITDDDLDRLGEQ